MVVGSSICLFWVVGGMLCTSVVSWFGGFVCLR